MGSYALTSELKWNFHIMHVKSLSLFLPFLLSSIVVLHMFSCYAATTFFLNVSFSVYEVHILQHNPEHNVGFSLWMMVSIYRWKGLETCIILSFFICSSVILLFWLLVRQSQTLPVLSVYSMRNRENTVVIFLTDATEQPVRAKKASHEEVRVIWIQREKEASVNRKSCVRSCSTRNDYSSVWSSWKNWWRLQDTSIVFYLNY